MKNILLATTAIVMTAGVASAEITWTGTVTAGIARDGNSALVGGTITDGQIAVLTGAVDATSGQDVVVGSGTLLSPGVDATELAAIKAYRLTAAGKAALAYRATQVVLTTAQLTQLQGDIAALSAFLVAHAGTSATTSVADTYFGGAQSLTIGSKRIDIGTVTTYGLDTLYSAVTVLHTAAVEALRVNGINTATAAQLTGDYKTYSEVNMTGAVSLTTDSGLTFKTAISIDAGAGYDLADDDKFDAAPANGRNGGSVGLDFVSVGGAFGTITIDQDDISMLVDGDDDSGDFKYKGTFGDVTVEAVFDQLKDTNVTASAVTVKGINGATATTTNQGTADDAGNGVDTAWSAAVSGTVQGVSYRYATDEEGGYAGSLGYTMSGLTVGLSTKLEAWEKDMNKPVHNGVSVAYAVEGLSINGAWDSVKDGNQTSWGVGYTGGDATVGFNTNEKNEWTATASLALGAGASLIAGVNYTDDAQVGVAFSF